MTRRRTLFSFCLLVCLSVGGSFSQMPSAADRDRDGYPDAAELYGQDRASFTDWFAAVAERQYSGMNAD